MVIFTVTFTAPPKQENGKQTDCACDSGCACDSDCTSGSGCACAAGAIAIRTAKNDVSAIRGAKMRRRNLLKGTGGSLVERSNAKGEDSPTHCDLEPRVTVGRHVE